MHKKTWSDYSSYFSAKSLIAGFTNIHFLYSSSNDRIEFAKILKLNYEKLIIPKQIHSGNVIVCNESGQLTDIDGIITNNKNFVLSLQVADCIPIYLYDVQNKNIGLIHAGWRGVALGIIENSINELERFDSNPINIKVLLGPSIRQCCFEVGPEVAKLFHNKYQKIGENDRMQLDLQSVVIDKLINMNIHRENIIDVTECTCCSDNYHSFRRNGYKSGRMIAMMGWQS